MSAGNKIYLGCHLSSADGFEVMGTNAVSIGANTFAFFTRNPRGGKAKDIDPEDAAALRRIMKEHEFGRLVAHAPYTLNPCSATARVREFAHMVMEDDLRRMEYLPGNYYNFHPGSHVGQGTETGIRLIYSLLNDIISKDQTTTVLLETMAGKGSEVGSRFEELAQIIEGIRIDEKVGVCMDTCHVSDAGYDIVNDLDGVLEEFDRIIGLERLKALHINDSMNPPGSHKDRHARIGEGTLGLEAIRKFIHHPALEGLPCILETPQDSIRGYGKEIAVLKRKGD
ncbi:endonuclease IV [Hornefia porci]|uniref:Probable endonuclease 4 n=1 Tax=Hornefia porci TaxID=2652292 RepID=A0A1Q9JIZ7_9FIRM|nr:deoxyribonuclease IV [Hornefia porci]OLR56107.1 endonuclease IV [Hornefia porci]